MTTMVSSISTIMVEDVVLCEVNVLVLLIVVARSCNGWKRRECVYLCDG